MIWRGPMGGGAASGRIGAMIASHCAQGQYLKSRVKCVNPRTFQQHPTRNAIKQLAVLWQEALTDDQRAAWNTYAANVTWLNRLGDTVHLSGQMEFIRSNANRLAFVGYYLPDAPTTFNRGDIGPAGTLSMGIGDALFTLTVDPAVPWLDGQITTVTYLWLGIPRSGGLGFIPRRTRFVDVIPGTAAGGVHVFSFGQWPPPAYNQSWSLFYSANFSDGRLTTPISTNVVRFGPPPPPFWEDAFPYANGPINGEGGWSSPISFYDAADVTANQFLTTGHNSAADNSSPGIPLDWTAPWKITLTFKATLGDNTGGNIFVTTDDVSTPTTLTALNWFPGDVNGNIISNLYLSTQNTFQLINLTNVACTTGSSHTLEIEFDGTNYSLTLDGVLLDSQPDIAAAGAATITLGSDNSAGTDTFAVSFIRAETL